ncbi:tyrosine-type recombinase/integrase [Microbacterium sp. BR1]|uniref:tyrosine-type recombinase/integrase n=1 Tax=Microbacterium sp. BR1 TaxID=1070896 RepID=UPI0012FE030F|nr:site-specific integrase [Microbacterium sp. BR1]
MNWETVLHHFALHQRAQSLSEKTIAERDRMLRTLATMSGRSPILVDTIDMLELLSRNHHRTGQPISAGTKQSERSYLRVWGKWMVDEGYRAHDPAARLPKVKVPRRRARPLHLEHVELLLDSGAYQRTRDIITIAALTGLRIGEVVKIRGEDIDWVTGTIRSIRKGSLDHAVQMPPPVRLLARDKPRTGWWFPSLYKNADFPEGGGHVLMKSASTGISRLLRRVGIVDPKITAHSLRHFYATMLLRGGVNVRVVQEMMGHASLATTQLYMEVTQDEMAEASNVLPMIDIRSRSGRGRLAA